MSAGRWACVLIVAILAGCIQPTLQTCGDLVCPASSVCLANGTCASEDAIAACADLSEGALCETPLFTGACSGGACISARCGDNVVEGSEQCDGSVDGVDCVDYGFDLGIPTCTDRCSYDVVNSCVRFGWKHVLATPARQIFTDGQRIAVLRLDYRGVDVYAGGQTVTIEGGYYYRLAGNAHQVVTATSAEVYRSDGGPFTAIDTTGISGQITELAIADDDTLYVGSFISTGCTVYERPTNGSWTVIRSGAAGECNHLWVRGGQVLLAVSDSSSTGTLLRWTGASWVPITTSPTEITAVAIKDGVYYLGTTTAGVMRYDGTTSFIGTGTVLEVVVLDSGVFTTDYGTGVHRVWPGTVEHFRTPIGGQLTTDGTNLYLASAGVYKFTGTQYSARSGLATVTDLTVLVDGTVAVTSSPTVAFPDDFYASWNFFQPSTLSAAIVAGRARDDVFVSDGSAINHFDGVGFTPLTVPSGPTIEDLWMPATGAALYAVGAQGLAMIYTGSGWSMLSPPPGTTGCDLHAIAGMGTEIVAAGSCGTDGVVWSLAGSSWTETYRGSVPLVAIAAAPTGDVFAAGPQGGVRRVSGTWTVDPAAAGTTISATSKDDVWVAGSRGVINWDGSHWSRLGVDGVVSVRVGVTAHSVFIGGAATSVLLR